MRLATPRRPALSLATARAAGEISMAVKRACSRTEARAMAMAPEPVPTSTMLRWGSGWARAKSRTASTRCGLRAGNEDVRGDAEAKAEELLRTGEVLERMLHGAARGEGAEGVEVARGEVVVGVGEEPRAVAMEDVGEQGLGIASGDGSGSFEERVAECHCLRARIKLADAAK